MNKLVKNWSYLLFSDISQAIINFFVFMLLARKLSPSGYGDFNVILAVVSIFSIFAVNFGANHVITREVTLNPETTRDIFRLLIPVRLASYILTVIALLIYVHLSKSGNTGIFLFSILLILSNSLWDLSESIAFGRFVTKFTTIFNLSSSILWLIIVTLLPGTGVNSDYVLSFYSGILLVRSLAYFITSYRKFTGEKDSLKIGIRSVLSMSMPYLWMRAFGAFSEQIPILLLARQSGNSEVGYFSVGFRLIIPITLAISTGLRAIFPFLTKLYFEDKNEFNSRLVSGFEFILIWGTMAATLLVSTSKLWIPFFFGPTYANSIQPFNMLAWFSVGLSFDLILSTVLSSTYKQNTLAIVTTVDFLIMFPILYIGTKYGAYGLATAKLIGMLLVIIYHIVVVIRLLKINIHNYSFYLSLLFFIIMMSANIFVTGTLYRIGVIILIFTFFTLLQQSPIINNIKFALTILRSPSGIDRNYKIMKDEDSRSNSNI